MNRREGLDHDLSPYENLISALIRGYWVRAVTLVNGDFRPHDCMNPLKYYRDAAQDIKSVLDMDRQFCFWCWLGGIDPRIVRRRIREEVMRQTGMTLTELYRKLVFMLEAYQEENIRSGNY